MALYVVMVDTCMHVMSSFYTSKWLYTWEVLDGYVYACYVFVLHVYYSSSSSKWLYTWGVLDGYVFARFVFLLHV